MAAEGKHDDDLTLSYDDPRVVSESEFTVGNQPERIAGFRIEALLGRGGMGVVWEAEQEQPRRRVALKVMRRDHVVDELHARLFRREVEVLARLKHPNIGAIYASGHTEEGHDYFAMELVRGPTLDEWLRMRPEVVDAAELELRLRLFLSISDAVHYAHQRGVIHRDLKPSNIIVTEDGDSALLSTSGPAAPTVKILDFGLARITDADVQATMVSEVGLIKGTLQYMSPEQARGQVDAIDTRSDVYALGVLLYEMLTGNRPYELAPAALVEAVRVICEQSPRSLAQSWSGTRKLDADLETIVGKALEKEADRRYSSVAAMADDVQRHLESKPIEARPPSAFYQLRKFAVRNRALVVSMVVALLTLLAFAATMTVQSQRIRREAERAARAAAAERQVTDFMIGLFDRSDPTLSGGEDVTAREILDAGAERIAKLDDRPRTQAAFMQTMGRVYSVLGEFERAAPLLERAIEIRTEYADVDGLVLADTCRYHANLLDQMGLYDDAEVVIRRSLEIRTKLGSDNRQLASDLNVLGNVLWHQGRLDQAEKVHRDALGIRQRVLPAIHEEIAESVHNLGALRYFAGDLAGAEQLWRRSAEIENATGGRDNHNFATSLHTLAIVISDQGRYDEALELELESLEIRETVLGPDHPHVALSLTTLGNIYRDLARPADAESVIRRALAIGEATYGHEHGEVWWMHRSLISTLTALGRFQDAEQEIERLMARIEGSASLSDVAAAHRTYGELLTAQGNWSEAEAQILRAISLLEEDEPGSPWVGRMTAELARLYSDAGRLDDARESFRRAIELMREGWGLDDPDVRRAEDGLAALEQQAAAGRDRGEPGGQLAH